MSSCGSPDDNEGTSSTGGATGENRNTTGGGSMDDPVSGGGDASIDTSGGASSGGTSDGGAAGGGAFASGGGATGGGTAASGGAQGQAGGTGGTTGEGKPSAGCNLAALPLASGKHAIDVAGTEREYILTLPDDASISTPLPLVFGFHGLKYDAEWVANGEEPLTGPYFGMADEANGQALFVAPQALSGGWSNQDGRDIAFVTALVEEFQEALCFDERRLFATGFSSGGIMTTTIGCELHDLFRAVAPQSARLATECSDGLPPLAYLGNHGTEDQTITIDQGELVRDSYAARNGCMATPGAADEHGCAHYEVCERGAPVTWCTFMGEHVPNPAAGIILWGFFSQF